MWNFLIIRVNRKKAKRCQTLQKCGVRHHINLPLILSSACRNLKVTPRHALPKIKHISFYYWYQTLKKEVLNYGGQFKNRDQSKRSRHN